MKKIISFVFILMAFLSQGQNKDLGSISKSRLQAVKQISELVNDLPAEFRSISTELHVKNGDMIGSTEFKGLVFDASSLKLLKAAREGTQIEFIITVDDQKSKKQGYTLRVKD